MPNFIAGLPAQGSQLISAEVRNNFLALNARTNKLTPRATTPSSASVRIGSGRVYFSDKILIDFPGSLVNLGDDELGVSPFNNIGYFRDIAIVLRVEYDQAAGKYQAFASFIEGPEKISSTPDKNLINFQSNEIPIALFTVRHNGLGVGVSFGQIEPITQSQILDLRGFLDAGGITYYSATVGDRQILEDGYGTALLDGYGDPIIEGETIGVFTGIMPDINGDPKHPIQRAIDFVYNAGGGTVLIRRGTYTPFETIVVPDNVQLIGEGANTTIVREDTFTGPLLLITGDRAKISNLHIEGPTTYSLAFGSLVQFSSSKNSTIEGCIIDASSVTGISFSDTSSRCICVMNYIIGAETGIIISSDSSKIIVTNNQLEDTSSIPINNMGTGTIKMNNIED